MAFEVYVPERISAGQPCVTISSLGRIAFNKPAAQILREQKMPRIQLLWDKAAAQIGMKPTHISEGTYAVNIGNPLITVTFSCNTFLNYIGYDWTQTRNFSTSWAKNHQMFIIQIPREFLGSAILRRNRVRTL